MKTTAVIVILFLHGVSYGKAVIEVSDREFDAGTIQ